MIFDSPAAFFWGFAHALFNFGIYAGFLVILYTHTMSAFVDNILQCFIFNSSLAKAEKGWGRWVVGGGLWVAVGGERRKKGRGKVGWSV